VQEHEDPFKLVDEACVALSWVTPRCGANPDLVESPDGRGGTLCRAGSAGPLLHMIAGALASTFAYVSSMWDPPGGLGISARRRGSHQGGSCQGHERATVRHSQRDLHRSVEGHGGGVLTEWLELSCSRLRPGSHDACSFHVNAYIVPPIGEVRLQALTGRRIKHLYAELGTNGRVRGGCPTRPFITSMPPCRGH
jgi:hypothetical protein